MRGLWLILLALPAQAQFREGESHGVENLLGGRGYETSCTWRSGGLCNYNRWQNCDVPYLARAEYSSIGGGLRFVECNPPLLARRTCRRGRCDPLERYCSDMTAANRYVSLIDGVELGSEVTDPVLLRAWGGLPIDGEGRCVSRGNLGLSGNVTVSPVESRVVDATGVYEVTPLALRAMQALAGLALLWTGWLFVRMLIARLRGGGWERVADRVGALRGSGRGRDRGGDHEARSRVSWERREARREAREDASW